MKKIWVTLVVPVVAAGLMLGGCSAQNQDTAQKEAVEISDTKKTELKTIGSEVTGEHVESVNITNNTGKNITGFAIKSTGMEDYSENLLASNDVFSQGEERSFSYDTTAALNATAPAENKEGDQLQLTPNFDVKLTFDDDSTAEVHGFPLIDAKDLVLKANEHIVFVSFTQVSTGAVHSTESSEQAIYDEAQRAAEEQAKQEQEAAAAAEQNNASNSNASTNTNYTAPAAPAQPAAPAPAAPTPAAPNNSANNGDGADAPANPDEGCIGGADTY